MSDTCPKGCDLRGSEIPAAHLPEGELPRFYSRKIGVEIRGVYDGVLYWQCPDCGHQWHRWPEGHDLRAAAERFMRLAEGVVA